MATVGGDRLGHDPWREVLVAADATTPQAATVPVPALRTEPATVSTSPVSPPRPAPGPGPRASRQAPRSPGAGPSRLPQGSRRQPALIAAVGAAAVALAAAAGALVAVHAHSGHAGGSGQARAGGQHASGGQGSGPISLPVSPSTEPTTADVAGASQAATQAGGAGGGGGAAPGAGNYPPANIADPTTAATAVVSSLPLYASPGAATPIGHLASPNSLGAPLVMMVIATQGDWVQGYVPMRPNEAAAWFPRADVRLSSVPFHIVVTISAHRLVLYKNNVAVFTAPVATGAPDSPTPTGSYYVAFIVKLTDPQNAYGPYALGTSDFSNTYYSFEGGPGQVGIHGTNQPWVIGSYASHGCIRLNNNDITALATQISPGTPVEISS